MDTQKTAPRLRGAVFCCDTTETREEQTYVSIIAEQRASCAIRFQFVGKTSEVDVMMPFATN